MARKAFLRRRTVERILAMDPEARRLQESQLIQKLADLPGFANARTVLIHASAFAEEVDTGPMLRLALQTGKRLVCPKILWERRQLRLFEVVDIQQDLVAGYKNIPEPRSECRTVDPLEIDWLLVPGLLFDRFGYRLGRGGGFYDRLLGTLRPETPRWSLILDTQWADRIPREPHDAPVDGVADCRQTLARIASRPVTEE